MKASAARGALTPGQLVQRRVIPMNETNVAPVHCESSPQEPAESGAHAVARSPSYRPVGPADPGGQRDDENRSLEAAYDALASARSGLAEALAIIVRGAARIGGGL